MRASELRLGDQAGHGLHLYPKRREGVCKLVQKPVKIGLGLYFGFLEIGVSGGAQRLRDGNRSGTQPRDQRLHRSNKRRYFQYAVRSTVVFYGCFLVIEAHGGTQ